MKTDPLRPTRVWLYLATSLLAAWPAAAQQEPAELPLLPLEAASTPDAPQPAANAPAAAAGPATRPATRPAAADGAQRGRSLAAEVVSVTGVVRKLLPDAGAKWQPVTVGEKLGELVVIRTGLGSQCVLNFADRGRVLIRSGSKAGIGTFVRRDEKVTANVGLKYGAVRATVDHTRGESDFSVSTALAAGTLRGSEFDVANTEMGPGFSQNTGQAELSYGTGLARRLDPGASQTDGKTLPGQLLASRLAPGVGDVNGGLTAGEQKILTNYFSGGNAGTFATTGSQTVATPSSTPSSLSSSYRMQMPRTRDIDFAGSGTFASTMQRYTFDAWAGSGTWWFDSAPSQVGTWTGGGTVTRGGQGLVATYSGAGTWRMGSDRGTFTVSATAGYPYSRVTDYGERFEVDQGTLDMDWPIPDTGHVELRDAAHLKNK